MSRKRIDFELRIINLIKLPPAKLIANAGIRELGILLNDYSYIRQNNLEIRYVEGFEKHLDLTLTVFKKSYDFLARFFSREIKDPLRLILVPDRKEYDRLVIKLLGVDIETPSNPGRLAQPQKTDLVFLHPSAYDRHSSYVFCPDEYTRLIRHELTHVFEEYLAPDIESSPRWWSEGLAVFLSRQWQYADQFAFRQPVLEGIEQNKLPDLTAIQNDIGLAYDWGWTLVIYIYFTEGGGRIVEIVKELDFSQADIIKELSSSQEQLELNWQEWLLTRGKKIICPAADNFNFFC